MCLYATKNRKASKSYKSRGCLKLKFLEVLMTTQTERENARYRKDVEKAPGVMPFVFVFCAGP